MNFDNLRLLIGSLLLLFGLSLPGQELKVGKFDGKDWAGIAHAESKIQAYEDTVKIQMAIHGEHLYVRVRIPQKEASLKHRPWVLKDEKFVVGKQIEDSLVLHFSQKGKKTQDLWFWGANRTQWGFADDGFLKEGKYSPDLGKGPWKLNLKLDTLHQNRSRYQQATSTESRSDIKVRAKHEKGEWQLVFSRLLYTGNDDDLNLKAEFSVSLSKDLKSSQSVVIPSSLIEVPQ
jgi:hypothetical protein